MQLLLVLSRLLLLLPGRLAGGIHQACSPGLQPAALGLAVLPLGGAAVQEAAEQGVKAASWHVLGLRAQAFLPSAWEASSESSAGHRELLEQGQCVGLAAHAALKSITAL